MKTIGIIAAMDEEFEQIMTHVDVKVRRNAVGMDFSVGILCGKNVVVVRSGVGKVNAAICAQVLIDLFAVDYVVNTGVAGAIDKNITNVKIILVTFFTFISFSSSIW